LGFDSLSSLQFSDPAWLWLLAVPGGLLVLWVRQFAARRRDARRLSHERRVPVRERFPVFGDGLFSLGLILASAFVIVALAGPGMVVSLVRKGGVDLVILLDGSASMHVRDVTADRWQRSVRFLRVLGDSMQWESDRIALTLFARIAAPQVRLTTDPNTFFFFLDHLDRASPFPLEDDTSWDTNSELAIHWGLRVIEKDEEIRGRSSNAPLFVLVSDGQSWSGEVEASLVRARARGVPVVTVGVGTLSGGLIPEGTPVPGAPPQPRIRSSLDRASLRQIATASGGMYYELDRDSDVAIASRIISDARRRVVTLPPEPRMETMYWQALALAGLLALAGALTLRDRGALVLLAAAGGLTLVALASMLR